MTDDAAALLGEAQRAFDAGAWEDARRGYEAALAHGAGAEAHFGLGAAVWWLGDTGAALRHWEQAYAAFRRRPDPAQAVLTAFYLCLAYRMSLGNDAAARGWLARAATLVEEHDLGPLRGWVLVARADIATDAGRPHEAEAAAREACAIGRATDDADLTLCATSELGAALVAMGRVEEGAVLLDEAMAAALGGEARERDTVVLVSCRTITACARGGEVRRATQWVRAADRFHREFGSPHLYATCRTQYGAILVMTGRWQEAEQELAAALRIGRDAEAALHAEALSILAALRLAQGRIEEAARLLDGYEDEVATAVPRAMVHLARGEAAIATAVLRRRRREVVSDCLEAAVLDELLVEAGVALADGSEAALEAPAVVAGGPHVAGLAGARGTRALGRIALAAGDGAAAAEHLERALAAFARMEMPYEAARTRLLLARALERHDPETAVAEARQALASLEQLGAGRDADAAAAFLRARGVKAARAGPRGVGLLTRRELEVLGLLGEGLSNRAIAERLVISRKTAEHHVASVLAKLALDGRAEAAAYAVRHLRSPSGPAGG